MSQAKRYQLADTDWHILSELQNDARMSYAELGRRIGMSSPAVQERVRRLEDAGIIEGYQAKINYPKIGLPLLALTRLIDVDSRDIEAVNQILHANPQVVSAHHVTGEDEYHIQVVGITIADIKRVLYQLKQHCNTTTSFVIETTINNRPITQDLLEELENA